MNLLTGTKRILSLAALGLVLAACDQKPVVELDDAFTIEQPAPTTVVTRLTLDDSQKGYVQEGNKLAFKFLRQLVTEDEQSFVCSPLSLQLALAMTANGAEGETLREMLDVLGYGREGMAALNAYARILIEQLPALDLDVKLKLADAILTTDRYTLKADFRETLRTYYYAPAASMPFSNPAEVLAQVNEWARRNTEGLIDPMLKEMSPNAVAYLMNALYFKAKWQGGEYNPMFSSDFTYDDTFYRADGSRTTVPFMPTSRMLPYADMGGYEIVALPYASGKFFFYILLPKKADGLDALVQTLAGASWNSLIAGLRKDAEVRLRMPKFDVSGDFALNKTLQALGMRRAFDEVQAEFGNLFDGVTPGFYISRVLQKAKMTVAEWGTEAAAVTVVEMAEKSALPGKSIQFVADHPFVFVLGEQDSGTILFEGVYTGK
jgi:serpin B